MSRNSVAIVLMALGFGLLATSCKNDNKTGETGLPTGDGGSAGDGGTECTDFDNDGFCEEDDCDDTDAAINPDAIEICDNVDNDCDGDIDEDVTDTYYADTDGDGFGDPDMSMEACEATDGWVPNATDCDDTDATVYPDATEICDGIDNDCDGDIDEDLDSATWYADADGDGWGNPDDSVTACEQPTGYVDNDLDCDDGDSGEPVIVSQSGPVSPPPTLPPPPDTADTAFPGDSGGMPDTADTGGYSGAGTADDPLATIQEGIDMANVCVRVYDGTYNEDIDFNGKNIDVFGVNGAENTVIQGTGDGAVVTFDSGETTAATLRGFTITGGTGHVTVDQETDPTCSSPATCTVTTYVYAGGGIYIDSSSPTLSDLIITGNELLPYSFAQPTPYDTEYVYSYGGGIATYNSSAVLRSLTISQNFADAGGGIYADADSNLSLTWVILDQNSASSGGGITSEGTVSTQNSIFVNNLSLGTHNIGGAAVDVPLGTFDVVNSTMTGNDGIASLFIGETATTNLLNAILVENADGFVVAGDTGATLVASYNDVYSSVGRGAYAPTMTDPTGVDGNISEDPLFVDWTDDDDFSNDDLHLQSSSPAVDAGSPASAYDDPDGTPNDMGAYGGPLGDW